MTRAPVDAERDPVEELAMLAPVHRLHILGRLTKAQREELIARWWRWAHPS